jgi:hypothetical protein
LIAYHTLSSSLGAVITFLAAPMRTMLSLLVLAAMMAGANAGDMGFDCAACKAKVDAVDEKTLCQAMNDESCPGVKACTAAPGATGATAWKCMEDAAAVCCEGKCTDELQDVLDCGYDECPLSDKDKSDAAEMGVTDPEALLAAMFGCATWF